jgi:hypothetical protein
VAVFGPAFVAAPDRPQLAVPAVEVWLEPPGKQTLVEQLEDLEPLEQVSRQLECPEYLQVEPALVTQTPDSSGSG